MELAREVYKLLPNYAKSFLDAFKWKPSRQQMFELFWQLCTYEEAGIPPLTALYNLSREERDPKMKAVLKEIWQEINLGAKLGQAFEKTGVFPEQVIASIIAGEEVGELAATFERIAKAVDKEDALMSKLYQAFYPLIYGGGGIVVAFNVLANVIVPKTEKMFITRRVEMPGFIKFVFGIIHFIKDYWFLFIIIGIGLYGGYRAFKKKYPEVFDRWLFKMPVFGDLYTALIQSRFIDALIMLDSSGIGAIRSLEYAGNVTKNEVIKSACKKAAGLITSHGMDMAKALERADVHQVIDPRIIAFLRTGETGGKISEILSKLAKNYSQRIEKKQKKFETKTILIVILVLGTIAALMYGTLFIAQSAMFKAITK